jgi:hypothetical protein
MIGTAALAGATLAVAYVARGRGDSPEFAFDSVEAILRRGLDYLQLDEEGVKTFLERYLVWSEANPDIQPWSDVVERYLKSTDFFQNGGDEGRVLRFVAFYDPHTSPCYSPFNRR